MKSLIACVSPTHAVLLMFVAAALHAAGCGDGGGGAAGGNAGATAKAYFSSDDGKTFFTDEATRIPPFKTAAGATAYRACVARCGSGEPFVAYLEKYADADKRSLENAMKNPQAAQTAVAIMLQGGNPPFPLVKKPLTGDKGWLASTPESDQQYSALTRPTCPDGTAATRVFPE